MMKALHQARATSPPGLASLAAHSLARSPVRPLLRVCSEICADACPVKARVAPRTDPRTLVCALHCDMADCSFTRNHHPFRWWRAASYLHEGHGRYDARSQGSDRTPHCGSVTTINNKWYSAFRASLRRGRKQAQYGLARSRSAWTSQPTSLQIFPSTHREPRTPQGRHRATVRGRSAGLMQQEGSYTVRYANVDAMPQSLAGSASAAIPLRGGPFQFEGAGIGSVTSMCRLADIRRCSCTA